ncbi:hypothetical protein [Frankia canadensis]|uniref:hypothetical protein n=1 Tax=Frankia canadensis TaxID=1836972 RepID=UPI0010569386|nr:hypothetical protein [Frankia canadensis]
MGPHPADYSRSELRAVVPGAVEHMVKLARAVVAAARRRPARAVWDDLHDIEDGGLLWVSTTNQVQPGTRMRIEGHDGTGATATVMGTFLRVRVDPNIGTGGPEK